jgi:hypothetical protein
VRTELLLFCLIVFYEQFRYGQAFAHGVLGVAVNMETAAALFNSAAHHAFRSWQREGLKGLFFC